MPRLRHFLHYLANLEWTERKQHDCIFCNRERLRDVVYEVLQTRTPPFFKKKSFREFRHGV